MSDSFASLSARTCVRATFLFSIKKHIGRDAGCPLASLRSARVLAALKHRLCVPYKNYSLSDSAGISQPFANKIPFMKFFGATFFSKKVAKTQPDTKS